MLERVANYSHYKLGMKFIMLTYECLGDCHFRLDLRLNLFQFKSCHETLQ